MSTPAIGTVVAKNYLPFARVLADSLRRQHPEANLVVALADELDDHVDPASEPFTIVTPDELGVPDRRDLAFRMTQREFAIVLKPFLIEHLLGSGSALFLDPDTLVLGSLDSLFEDVEQHALTLVPHRVVPPRTSDGIERDLILNLAGVFNGGVVGMTGGPSSSEFLRWWQMRVHRVCLFAVDRGIHYDQRWLDLALGFVDDLHLHKDPCVDVAHWNLPERPIAIHDGVVTVHHQPCRLFHFSGFDPDEPERPTRYRPELRMDDVGEARELFRRYARELDRAGWASARAVPYGYGSFDNGVPIPEAARRLFADVPDRARFGDPFTTRGRNSYFRWLNESGSRLGGPSRLWLYVHSMRPDLQLAIPKPTGRHRRVFRKWTRTHGVREHDIPRELV